MKNISKILMVVAVLGTAGAAKAESSYSVSEYYAMEQPSGKLLAITDSSRSDIAEISDMSLYCPTGTRLFLNTIAAPVLAINCLTMAVSLEMNRCGRESNLSEDFAKIFENEN